MGSQTALIYANSNQNAVIIQSSLFENNDMVWNNTRPDTHSFIVESLGPTTIENTCFQDNAVGASDVVVFGSSFTSRLNYANTNTSGSLCDFSAVFENVQQFDSFTPLCVEATSTECSRYVTGSPTVSPSSAPTPVVSDSPSAFPTPQPTITAYPSPLPTLAPTLSPGSTLAPTQAPIEFTFPEDTETPSGGFSKFGWSSFLSLSGSILYFLLLL
jgi:hypothetical protein